MENVLWACIKVTVEENEDKKTRIMECGVRTVECMICTDLGI